MTEVMPTQREIEANQRRLNEIEQARLMRADPGLAWFYRMSCADSRWPALSKKYKEKYGI